MISYSTKVVPLKLSKKEGCFSLQLRVIIDRKKLEIYLNIDLQKLTDFDFNKQLLKSNTFNAENYNIIIRKHIQKATQYFSDCDLKEIPYSIAGFKDFFNKKISSNDFYSFANNAISEMEGLITKDTLKCYRCEISKLKKFKPSLSFRDIDVSFIRAYEQYMRLDLLNKTNTVAKTFKKLKRLLNIAIEKQMIEKSAFDTVKLKYEKSNRVFLSVEELEKIEVLMLEPTTDKKIKNICTWFLFSCYTGLRYSDLCKLTWENIENNKINIIQEKTNEAVYIPIISKAIDLLPDSKIKTGRIFKVYSNQKCNEYLKLVNILSGLKKVITFHCSRHTFATVSLNLGIRFEVVSKLLGHSDLKTTKIYARLLNETTDAEMLKWNRA